MKFLVDNWFSIVSVVTIIFVGIQINKMVGGNIRGGGCCSGTFSSSDNSIEKKELDEDRKTE